MRRLAASLYELLRDRLSFETATLRIWLVGYPPETDIERAIRERGARMRRTFPGFYQHEHLQFCAGLLTFPILILGAALLLAVAVFIALTH
jgi:hypothetical protein